MSVKKNINYTSLEELIQESVSIESESSIPALYISSNGILGGKALKPFKGKNIAIMRIGESLILSIIEPEDVKRIKEAGKAVGKITSGNKITLGKKYLKDIYAFSSRIPVVQRKFKRMEWDSDEIENPAPNIFQVSLLNPNPKKNKK